MSLDFDIKKLLQEALEERCHKNPKYSLRAFARDLAVSPPRLSRWLGGKEGLSRSSALALAKKLGLTTQETDALVLIVESKYGRAKKIREAASEKLKEISGIYRPLDIEAFKVIADWYNLATLSLVETESFHNSAEWVAARLGISIYEARGALQRLEALEMVEQTADGRLRPTGIFFANPTGIPSASVRSFHAQILEKAKAALELQTTESRDFSALILAVDERELSEAKRMIKIFREEFEARFSLPETSKREVYALGIQFFSLTQNGVLK